MQAMVAAVFSRLRHLSPDDDLAAAPPTSSAASVTGVDVDVAAGANGLRMVAPDPRSAQIPAAGPVGEDGPEDEADEREEDKKALLEDEKDGLVDGEAIKGASSPSRLGPAVACANS